MTVLKLLTERAVKALVSRERPGTSIGTDVADEATSTSPGRASSPVTPCSSPRLAGVVTPYLSGRWRLVPWVLVLGVMVGRVYVGAHNPLDVVCGAALGVAIAGAVNLASGVHHRSSITPTKELVP